VFTHHYTQLVEAGFTSAERVLEIGPGRNIGTALLWWAHLSSKSPQTEIVCWDVFPNADVDVPGFWRGLAVALLEATPQGIDSAVLGAISTALEGVAEGQAVPSVTYQVEPLEKLEAARASPASSFDLVYSHAAIEHVWSIAAFWDAQARLTAPAGWHSHRIDMADHGKRDTNYIELLEWSPIAYWLMLRFVPGATNRWRACHYLAKLEALGFKILIQRRTLEARLPIPLARIYPEFRGLADEDLRAVALDVVARGPTS
jgi:SAM-dependent methyltransferase